VTVTVQEISVLSRAHYDPSVNNYEITGALWTLLSAGINTLNVSWRVT